MKFILKYLKNDNLIETESSNDDINVIINDTLNKYSVVLKPINAIKLVSAICYMDYKYDKDDYIFANGYQSWTYTKEWDMNSSLKIMKDNPKLVKLYDRDKYGDESFKKYDKNVIHGWDYSYVRGINPIFIANDNYLNAYLIINHDKLNNQIIFEADINGFVLNKEFCVFDFVINTNKLEDSINSYFENKKVDEDKIIGYTSWYNRYQDINEESIIDDLSAIDTRFNLFQIDDGYETFVGDWLDVDKNKFPNGLEGIVKKIEKRKLKPGIWLAPFVAEGNSNLYKNHKELFAKYPNGEIIRCGANWSNFYLLDLDNPDARKHIVDSLNYYKNLGFKFFKLDFLYAVGLKKCETKTRAMIVREAYEFLADNLEGLDILGCGAIISSSSNLFKYLRIGPDVTLNFKGMKHKAFPLRESPSTKETIENTIFRSIFNGHLFNNDPDVFLLRKKNIKLNDYQKVTLATINALFGNVLMMSDNLRDYNDIMKQTLVVLLNIFNNATNKKYQKNKDYINISYEIKGRKANLIYSIKKGVFVNGR